jgi:hypothetical protein
MLLSSWLAHWSLIFSLLFANVPLFSRKQTFGTEQHPDDCQRRFPPPKTSPVSVSWDMLKLYFWLLTTITTTSDYNLLLYLIVRINKRSKFYYLITNQTAVCRINSVMYRTEMNSIVLYSCMDLYRLIDNIQTGICRRIPLAGSNRMVSKD